MSLDKEVQKVVVDALTAYRHDQCYQNKRFDEECHDGWPTLSAQVTAAVLDYLHLKGLIP